MVVTMCLLVLVLLLLLLMLLLVHTCTSVTDAVTQRQPLK